MTPPKPAHVLVIRTCNADMTSHGGFKWPESGMVEAPDWSAEPVCGQGLHGLAQGVGDYSLLSGDHDAKWMVVKVATSEMVAIDRAKVKFRRGEVVYCGAMAGALNLIAKEWAELARASAKGQHASKAETHAAAQGDYGHAAAQGNSGHAAAQGNSGHAAAQGNYGHAAAQGNYGTAFAGFGGQAKAAATGSFAIAWLDSATPPRARLIVGHPGENGIKPDVWYRVGKDGQLEEVAS